MRRRLAGLWRRCAGALPLLGLVAVASAAPPEPQAMARALERASQAVVGVSATAVDDARSNSSLGREREGSGIVIDADGLVLTIGYLVLEAEQVQLELDAERVVPARVVAYDVATGFGLLRALVPLRIEPVPLASIDADDAEAPLMVATREEISLARLMSRRAFAGHWEYFVDAALFTAPPVRHHSGAGLFNLRGELVGVGSLAVADTLPADDPRRAPGNLFVPVDGLGPILAELLAHGRSKASQRAWLGVNCAERGGQVRVLRVSADSPAEAAGLLRGDRIVRIDGTEVRSLAGLWQTLWAGGAAERDVRLEIERDGQSRLLTVRTVDRTSTLSRAKGI